MGVLDDDVLALVGALAAVVAVSLVSLVGVAALGANEQRVQGVANGLVAFAVGALLGDAFVHLVPEAFARPGASLRSSLLILGGLVLFFLVEKLLRHEHGPLHRRAHPQPPHATHLAVINVVGDAVHNFIDGAMIAASYLVSPALGVSTTLAVVLHEIPQELGDFGVLVHSGLSVRRAVLVNFGSALLAIVGALVTLGAGASLGRGVEATLVPVTAGGFVYIAGADLIPELQHDRSLRGMLAQTALIFVGIAVMAALTLLE